jgi:hypothetical protein
MIHRLWNRVTGNRAEQSSNTAAKPMQTSGLGTGQSGTSRTRTVQATNNLNQGLSTRQREEQAVRAHVGVSTPEELFVHRRYEARGTTSNRVQAGQLDGRSGYFVTSQGGRRTFVDETTGRTFVADDNGYRPELKPHEQAVLEQANINPYTVRNVYQATGQLSGTVFVAANGVETLATQNGRMLIKPPNASGFIDPAGAAGNVHPSLAQQPYEYAVQAQWGGKPGYIFNTPQGDQLWVAEDNSTSALKPQGSPHFIPAQQASHQLNQYYQKQADAARQDIRRDLQAFENSRPGAAIEQNDWRLAGNQTVQSFARAVADGWDQTAGVQRRAWDHVVHGDARYYGPAGSAMSSVENFAAQEAKRLAERNAPRYGGDANPALSFTGNLLGAIPGSVVELGGRLTGTGMLVDGARALEANGGQVENALNFAQARRGLAFGELAALAGSGPLSGRMATIAGAGTDTVIGAAEGAMQPGVTTGAERWRNALAGGVVSGLISGTLGSVDLLGDAPRVRQAQARNAPQERGLMATVPNGSNNPAATLSDFALTDYRLREEELARIAQKQGSDIIKNMFGELPYFPEAHAPVIVAQMGSYGNSEAAPRFVQRQPRSPISQVHSPSGSRNLQVVAAAPEGVSNLADQLQRAPVSQALNRRLASAVMDPLTQVIEGTRPQIVHRGVDASGRTGNHTEALQTYQISGVNWDRAQLQILGGGRAGEHSQKMVLTNATLTLDGKPYTGEIHFFVSPNANGSLRYDDVKLVGVNPVGQSAASPASPFARPDATARPARSAQADGMEGQENLHAANDAAFPTGGVAQLVRNTSDFLSSPKFIGQKWTTAQTPRDVITTFHKRLNAKWIDCEFSFWHDLHPWLGLEPDDLGETIAVHALNIPVTLSRVPNVVSQIEKDLKKRTARVLDVKIKDYQTLGDWQEAVFRTVRGILLANQQDIPALSALVPEDMKALNPNSLDQNVHYLLSFQLQNIIYQTFPALTPEPIKEGVLRAWALAQLMRPELKKIGTIEPEFHGTLPAERLDEPMPSPEDIRKEMRELEPYYDQVMALSQANLNSAYKILENILEEFSKKEGAVNPLQVELLSIAATIISNHFSTRKERYADKILYELSEYIKEIFSGSLAEIIKEKNSIISDLNYSMNDPQFENYSQILKNLKTFMLRLNSNF